MLVSKWKLWLEAGKKNYNQIFKDTKAYLTANYQQFIKCNIKNQLKTLFPGRTIVQIMLPYDWHMITSLHRWFFMFYYNLLLYNTFLSY